MMSRRGKAIKNRVLKIQQAQIEQNHHMIVRSGLAARLKQAILFVNAQLLPVFARTSSWRNMFRECHPGTPIAHRRLPA